MDLSEKTRIPLFLVISAIPVFAGFMFWMSTIYLTASAANEVNVKQDQKIDDLRGLIIDVRDRVIRIEEGLKNNRGNRDERN